MKQTTWESWSQAHMPMLQELLLDLCRIPAPSHHEEQRAAFVKQWLEEAGAKNVIIDEAKNVVLAMDGSKPGPYATFIAHTDTVFPDMEPFTPVIEGDILRCPACGDDTANLAVMMMVMRYILESGLQAKTGVLFAANSCEEGLGNLKGVRQLMSDYAGRVRWLLSFDGGLSGYVNRAVGSHRYRVRITTEGGHSYGAFGNRNAIQYLASMINTLYQIKVPVHGDSRTTYNVGTISGGTSVNTIAQDAEMLYEYRSNDLQCLNEMRVFFESVVNTYRAMGIGVEVTLVGDRPCMGDVPEEAFAQLQETVAAAMQRHTGEAPAARSGSTDCNIPLSQGIPAVCMGFIRGKGAHTREEWLELSSLEVGMRVAGDLILPEFV